MACLSISGFEPWGFLTHTATLDKYRQTSFLPDLLSVKLSYLFSGQKEDAKMLPFPIKFLQLSMMYCRCVSSHLWCGSAAQAWLCGAETCKGDTWGWHDICCRMPRWLWPDLASLIFILMFHRSEKPNFSDFMPLWHFSSYTVIYCMISSRSTGCAKSFPMDHSAVSCKKGFFRRYFQCIYIYYICVCVYTSSTRTRRGESCLGDIL